MQQQQQPLEQQGALTLLLLLLHLQRQHQLLLQLLWSCLHWRQRGWASAHPQPLQTLEWGAPQAAAQGLAARRARGARWAESWTGRQQQLLLLQWQQQSWQQP